MFELVILLIYPCRIGKKSSGTKFLHSGSKKSSPTFSIFSCSWCGWYANQILATIYCVVPPVMEEASKSEPGIFSLIYGCNCISYGMYWVWKWSCHRYPFYFYKIAVSCAFTLPTNAHS